MALSKMNMSVSIYLQEIKLFYQPSAKTYIKSMSVSFLELSVSTI